MKRPRAETNLPHSGVRALAALALPLALAACGDDATDNGGSGGTGTGTGSGGGGGPQPSAAPVGVTASSTAVTSSATSGDGGGGGGAPALCDVGVGGFEAFEPTPESIEFEALGALPTGEQILFNDWNAFPNTVSTMAPDGGAAAPVFAAYRVWSMGVSPDGSTIAFSSGDPDQVEHFGITLGDAIQHTFLYDAATETATNLTQGNINDECHHFSDDGERLYLCRRYDTHCVPDEEQQIGFWVSDGYRVGRVELASGELEFLTPESDEVYTLALQPDAEEATGIFQWIDIATNTWSIRRLTLEGGEVELIHDEAGFPVLSPDGTRFLYRDFTDQGSLWSGSVAGGDDVLVADRQGSNARWSPDGTRVVYLIADADDDGDGHPDVANCDHVEVVAADGSEADAPTRIRDCYDSDEYITELAWITR